MFPDAYEYDQVHDSSQEEVVMLRSKRFAFTLIELILVVAIIGLLLALLTPATRRIPSQEFRPLPTIVNPGEVQANDHKTNQSAVDAGTPSQP